MEPAEANRSERKSCSPKPHAQITWAPQEDRLAHALLLHCLPVSMYVYPLPEISLHEIGWLTLGIEFIWVYAAAILLGILMSLCLALSLPLVDIVRRAVVESIKARMNG